MTATPQSGAASGVAVSGVAVSGAAEPFFFEGAGGARLFGVWRPAPASEVVWVVCPPFAEEEKSAHRTLVELCNALRNNGHSSLFIAYRGTGDSSGDFSEVMLSQWREDILAACTEARRRAPQQRLGLLGLRLGASLAIELAAPAGADHLLLMEPVPNGRQYVGAMSKRKSLRAMMTQQEAAQSGVAPTAPSPPPAPAGQPGVDDFDGWGMGAAMRAEMEALDLTAGIAPFAGSSLLIQIGPREQVAAPLQKLADALGASVTAVTMQPFWNLLDYVRPDALMDVVVNYRFNETNTGSALP